MEPLIGAVINALPLEHMIGAPLQAMIKAQVQASRSCADFLMSVCIKDGKATAVQFYYDETVVDEQGVIRGTVKRVMSVPLLAIITHPNISIEEGTIDFDLEVTQSESDNSDNQEEGSLDGDIGWGPFKVKLYGRVSHKSAQTRTSDTRAKYSIQTQVKRLPPSEALLRVIDFLTDAAIKPGVHPVSVDEIQPKEVNSLSPAVDSTVSNTVQPVSEPDSTIVQG